MSDKMESPQSKGGGNRGRFELAVIMVLLVAAITASAVMADSSKGFLSNCNRDDHTMVADTSSG